MKIGPSLAGVVIGFVLLAVLIGSLERIWPSTRGQAVRRRGFLTDVAYWFFTPFVTRGISRGGTLLAVVLVSLVWGVPLERESVLAFLEDGSRAVRRQPLVLQVLEVLLLGDLVGYWVHRLFHGRRLWRFHAVHHGSKDLDWLSAVRLHPVNDVVARVAQVVPVVLLGFPPTILVGYVPFLTLWAIFIHANVPWSFGPLRYVISSPAFHRWHHTSEEEGLDKNFAGLFPFFDLLFGTFYLPADRRAQRFGLLREEVPEGLVGQLLYPFRRASA